VRNDVGAVGLGEMKDLHALGQPAAHRDVWLEVADLAAHEQITEVVNGERVLAVGERDRRGTAEPAYQFQVEAGNRLLEDLHPDAREHAREAARGVGGVVVLAVDEHLDAVR